MVTVLTRRWVPWGLVWWSTCSSPGDCWPSWRRERVSRRPTATPSPPPHSRADSSSAWIARVQRFQARFAPHWVQRSQARFARWRVRHFQVCLALIYLVPAGGVFTRVLPEEYLPGSRWRSTYKYLPGSCWRSTYRLWTSGQTSPSFLTSELLADLFAWTLKN